MTVSGLHCYQTLTDFQDQTFQLKMSLYRNQLIITQADVS